jgi:hypothetical protein
VTGRFFEERIFGVPWSALVVFALAVAVVYVAVDMGVGATGLRWLLVRWGHPVAWLLLALAALAMTKLTPLPAAWAGPLGAAGGVAYLAFLVATLSGRG